MLLHLCCELSFFHCLHARKTINIKTTTKYLNSDDKNQKLYATKSDK